MKELKERVFRWCRARKSVSVPAVQAQFDLEYTKAREVIRLLTEEKLLEYTGGLAYARPKLSDEEIDEKTTASRLTAERFAKIEERRRAFSERTRIRKEDELLDEAIIKEKEDRKRLFDRLTGGFVPTEVSGEYFVNTDVSYPNDKKIVIKAVAGEENYFSDCGRTMAYLKSYLKTDDLSVKSQIESVLSAYNIQNRNDELVITVRELSLASETFLFLYAAIERLIHLRAGSLWSEAIIDMRKKCVAALQEVATQAKTLAEAKTAMSEKITQAKEARDMELLSVYTSSLRALEEITEKNYLRMRKKWRMDT